MARGVGRVAAGHERTAEVAAHLLREGGNAFDAVVAAGFAAAACEPVFTSLGGGGFCLARTAAGETTLFDFFVDTPGRGAPAAELEPHFHPAVVRFPAADQVFNVGLGSVAVPGVLAAGLTTHLPLSPGSTTQAVSIQGGQTSEPGNQLLVNWRTVTPGYLSTMGIPLLSGRGFDEAAIRDSLPVAVVNEPFARRYWPGRDPLGQRFNFGGLDSD